MPLDLHIIHASDFVRAGASGQPDLRASKAALAKLAAACRSRGTQRALLDLRAVHLGSAPMFTPVELASLVDTFHEIGFSQGQRLAVLYSADPYHGARMFAFIGEKRGWNVKAFGSYEDAIAWLALAEEAFGQPEQAGPGESSPAHDKPGA